MISKAVFFVLVLTVAFIIGFVTAWLYFRRKWKYPLGELQGEMLNLKSKVNILEAEKDELKAKLIKQKQVVNTQVNGSETVTSKIVPEYSAPNEALLAEKKVLSTKHDSLLKENETMLIKLEDLQKQLEECQQSKQKNLMFTDGNPAEKDDLKLIHGIGPFIEKKLNNLGIYHFRQISNFNPILIEKVTHAIEFFPGRIERDNWMAQAKDLDSQKAKS